MPIATQSWRGTEVTKKKKPKAQNPLIPVCECLVLIVQVMAQALQYFSSPHCDSEHFLEYNNLLYLKNITALQRQANNVRPHALLKAGVPGIPWQHQSSSSIHNLKKLPFGETSDQQKYNWYLIYIALFCQPHIPAHLNHLKFTFILLEQCSMVTVSLQGSGCFFWVLKHISREMAAPLLHLNVPQSFWTLVDKEEYRCRFRVPCHGNL